MALLSLAKRNSSLADPSEQIRVLNSLQNLPKFSTMAALNGTTKIAASTIDTLQINLGRLCNQICSHCHVDAGPDRKEAMTWKVAAACLDFLQAGNISTLDITGGAPEMNPYFRELVVQARSLGKRVIDRSNLTILVAPGFDDLPEFLANNSVEIIASLPCYLQENVDKQRGNLVFERSVCALKRLNKLGYGGPGSPLNLTLVFNPSDHSLPPDEGRLEDQYRQELRTRYGIEFQRLITITNMPISRFLDDLLKGGKLEEYMRKLVEAFNPKTIPGLMCRNTLSVDWQGNLFDCDFNQMLNLGLSGSQPQNILNLREGDMARLLHREILTGQHCFGCTAGAGSGCQGSLAPSGNNPQEVEF